MTAQNSPNRPRPEDQLVREVADTLARIEANYGREGSGPGSRFEGRLLEDVQAELAVRMVRGVQRDLLERIITTYSVQKIHVIAADALIALEGQEP